MTAQQFWMLGINLLWHPLVLIESLILATVYFWLVVGSGRHYFAHSQPVTKQQWLSFLAGIGVFYLAFGSPIDYLANHLLFSAYMLQNILEMIVMTPLFLSSIPAWVIEPVAARVVNKPFYQKVSKPFVRALAFNVVFVAFHLPPVFNQTLLHPWLHVVEHFVFFLLAIFLWMPILSPTALIARLRPAAQVVYIFFAGNLLMPLIILLLFTQEPFYRFYLQVPRVFSIPILADQQLGLIIMLVGMLVPFFSLGVYAYSRYDNALLYR
ncbi:cytochrome c oxidase assembly protein [Sulfoacidibacillus thermotolerans]|uniref:Cytochrome c oxidase assembly protein n=1 Tax=Sulfoacidibacillus thermotolerans TaxID=1765684 RepID=A0A2U3D803_SULT2|nr:cytochrome c oxidase assembly protein [Sulfoacidibacillus thermotolerans]PWI57400.1 hypothetical protein BM613_08730 [Sulfoacidibacillus thermotolerans]